MGLRASLGVDSRRSVCISRMDYRLTDHDKQWAADKVASAPPFSPEQRGIITAILTAFGKNNAVVGYDRFSGRLGEDEAIRRGGNAVLRDRPQANRSKSMQAPLRLLDLGCG